jgi:hypothetical protein
MKPSRALFLLVMLLGVASAASFHSSGAIDAGDALTASALRHGVGGSPPAPITSRILGLGVDLVRLVWAPTGLFRAMHLTGGLLLAFAAALSALVARRLAEHDSRARLAAGLLVGVLVLFGASFAALGRKGGPFGVVVVLLAGCASAWTSRAPGAFAGGALLGLAAAEHPFVLFLLPAFAALGRRAAGVERAAASFWARAGAGFALGLAAIFLPILDSAGHPLVDAGDPGTPARALAAWWGPERDPFWRPGGPRRWAAGAVELALGIWRNAGPIGVLVAACGAPALLRLPRPALAALLPAAAILFGQPRDGGVATALAVWPLLFLCVPGVIAIAGRLASPRLAVLGPAALGPIAGAFLLVLNSGTIDRSAERGVAWARDSFAPLPSGSLLVTASPVHLALASDGERPDLDLVYTGERSTLETRRTGAEVHAPPLRAGEKMTGDFLHELVGLNHGIRPVMLEPALFFEADTRQALLGGRWRAQPHGIAFRVMPRDRTLSEDEERELARTVELWGGFDLAPGTPPSPLRDGLAGDAFYARSLLQSAALFLEAGRLRDAEREFLFALTLEAANRTVAAYGLGRVFFQEENFPEAVAVLEQYVSDSDDGAWTANRLLSSAHFRTGHLDEGLRVLERALRQTPPALVREREEMTKLMENMRSRAERARREG